MDRTDGEFGSALDELRHGLRGSVDVGFLHHASLVVSEILHGGIDEADLREGLDAEAVEGL